MQVAVVLCLYHASENMKKRFGPLVKAHVARQKSSSSSSSLSSSQIPDITSPETHPVEDDACEGEEETCDLRTEHDPYDDSDLKTALTFKSWYRIWTWLREAPTMSTLRERMDKILEVYTSHSARTYLDFLFSIAVTWAVCCFNWTYTLGMQSTQKQEGVHWTLKAKLLKKKVELHKVPQFFRDVMQTRYLTRERNTSAANTLLQMHLRAKESGYLKFSEQIKIYLTREGQQNTLERLLKALDFQVSPIANEADIRCAMKQADITRNSSAKRFGLLVDAVYPVEGQCVEHPPVLPIGLTTDQSVKFFKVKSRKSDGTVDVVAVLGNGSFACTDPTFANCGLPCKHIMAVFLNGDAYINPGLHYNQEYVVPLVRSLSIADLLPLSVAADAAEIHTLTPLADGAASDYAVRITEYAWSVVGHGGEQFSKVIRPASHAFQASKDSVKETLRKELLYLQPILTNRKDILAEFYVWTAHVRSKMAEEARTQAFSVIKATTGKSQELPHVAAKLYVDRSNKRKVSGDNSK